MVSARIVVEQHVNRRNYAAFDRFLGFFFEQKKGGGGGRAKKQKNKEK